jgi:hypothetical protein
MLIACVLLHPKLAACTMAVYLLAQQQLWSVPERPLRGTAAEQTRLTPCAPPLCAQEMKAEMAQSLEAGGRDPSSLAGRRLTELIRHKRIMRPARLVRPAPQRVIHTVCWVAPVSSDL